MLARPPGAPNAVHVAFHSIGHVKVNHVGEIVYVQAPGRNVGGHHQLHLLLTKPHQQTLSLGLAEVAMVLVHAVARRLELAGQISSGAPGADENDRRFRIL